MRFATLLLCSCSVLLADDGTVVDGDLGKKLDGIVEQSSPDGAWGAVLVAREGKVILAKGYGAQDYDKTPNTPKTLFELASASKQFTAAAALKAEMLGFLKTEDLISKHLKGVPKDKEGITIHHLATHTSGVNHDAAILPYNSEATTDEFIAHVLAAPMDVPPGTRFEYSNACYALLAAVVEKASGQPFDDFCRKELFEPAGLVDTGFIRDPKLDAARASTRRSEGADQGTCVDWHWGWGYRGMGGVVTTVYDMLAWDRALRGDKVLDAKAREKLYRVEKDSYAYGWMMETTSRGTTHAYHGGGVAGYGTWLSRYLEEDVAIFVLGNDEGNPLAIEQGVSHALFPGGVEATIHFGKFDLGEFQNTTIETGTRWEVRKDGEQVVLTIEDPGKKAQLAEVRLAAAAARAVAAQIQAFAAEKRAAGAKPEKEAEMSSGAYLGGYSLPKEGQITLSGLDLKVMPKYVGQDENGTIEIDRVTLILIDPEMGQWPIMVQMNLACAEAFVASLEKALGK